MYWPYATDYRGLGVIDPTDMWRTGRPYGLPGTATIHIPSNGGAPTLMGADAGGVLGEPWYKTKAFIGASAAVGGLLAGFLVGRTLSR
jgi:hypothetical protein